MRVKKNVGTLDAYVRTVVGVTMVACGTARAARRPGALSDFLVVFGGMKIAEGVTRFDPLWSALGISTMDQETGLSRREIRRRAAQAFSEPVTEVYPHLNDRRADIPPQPTIT